MSRSLILALLAACSSHAATQPDANASTIDVPPDNAELFDAPGGACAVAAFSNSCTPVTEAPADLVLSGISVRQLSSSGTNVSPYYDVPSYSACSGRVVYNQTTDKGAIKNVITANADGSEPLQVDTAVGGGIEGGVNLTDDGTLAYYVARSDTHGTAVDLFGVRIGDATCTPQRISTLAVTPTNGDTYVKISTPAEANGHRTFAFAVDSTVHRVADDGTPLDVIPFADPNNTLVFHRFRLNPVCPNIVMYRRDNGGSNGEPAFYAADLANDPTHAYAIATDNNAHQLWSPDGRQVGYAQKLTGTQYAFTIADVVTASCTLALDGHGGFATHTITPANGDSTLFCSWVPDGSSLVCENGCIGGPDHLFNLGLDGHTTLLLDTERNCAGGNPSYLSQADANLAADKLHLTFTSDRTTVSQVYLATLPAGLVP